MNRTRIEVDQRLTFHATSGRQIPVIVQSLRNHYATVAQVADTSKVREVPIEQLRTADGGFVATQEMLDYSAKMAPLQQALNAANRYECLECSAQHNRSSCPQCGSTDRIESVR